MNIATDYTDCKDYAENYLRESEESEAKKSALSNCELLM